MQNLRQCIDGECKEGKMYARTVNKTNIARNKKIINQLREKCKKKEVKEEKKNIHRIAICEMNFI